MTPLATLLLLPCASAAGPVDTEYMQHAPRTDLPPECTQLHGLLHRCRARVVERGMLGRAAAALGYGGCGGLERKLLACARQYRQSAEPQGGEGGQQHGQFGADWQRSEELTPPPRRSRADGLTAAVFHREYLSKGRPVVITDAARGWRALGWDFAAFSKAAAELKWAEVQPWNMAMDAEHVNRTAPLTLERYHSLLPEYPHLYIAWSNKLFNVGSLLDQGEYNHPYFLPSALRKPSFEWVYAGAQHGPGAVGHMDVLCQCSWALQIQGTKRWWLRSPLLEGAATGADAGGAGVTYEFLQQPGEVLFFCPGWWHSTYVEEEEGEEGTEGGGNDGGEGGTDVASLSLHAYVDLRPVGWEGKEQAREAEGTDLLRTSVMAPLIRGQRGCQYSWGLVRSRMTLSPFACGGLLLRNLARDARASTCARIY